MDGALIAHGAAIGSTSIRPSREVTVPGKPGDDLGIGTLNSVWKQAGLKK
jgi:HicA toxin of bacterial toxin-antitoxin,